MGTGEMLIQILINENTKSKLIHEGYYKNLNN